MCLNALPCAEAWSKCEHVSTPARPPHPEGHLGHLDTCTFWQNDSIDSQILSFFGEMTRHSNYEYNHLRVDSFCQQGHVSKCPSGGGGLLTADC